MTTVYKFSEEVAREHLQTLLDFYDIDDDDSQGVAIDGDDVGADVKASHKRIVRALRKGTAEIETLDDGAVVARINLVRTKGVDSPLVFNEMTGATNLVAAKKGIAFDDMNGQILATIAGMTKRDYRDILALRGQDILLAKAFGLLFFAA